MTIAAVPGRRKAMALLALGVLGGCAVPQPRGCAATAPGDVLWVTGPGWHTEIWLRAADLRGPLARLPPLFPGAAALGFGFGKRSFMLAQAGAVEELLLGPVPGAGVVQVKALSVLPPEAWPGQAIALALPAGGLDRLQGFLADSIAEGESLALRGSFFLPAARDYSLAYTCNTWTAEALREAGVPVSPTGILFAFQLRALAQR